LTGNRSFETLLPLCYGFDIYVVE